MPYARRTDANHQHVIATLRRGGWYVKDTSGLGGFFDAIAVKVGRVLFCEIKDGDKPPSARKLTEAEAALHADFLAAGAVVVVLESIDQAASL